jgi:DNA replication protein DnaC
MEGIESQDLEELLTELYRGVVEDRGNEFRETNNTEMGKNITAVAEWMTGPRLTTSLLLQGTPGSGKTSLMNALYLLYRYYYSNSTYRCTAKMINDNYQSKLDKERSYYEEFKKADYLFIDDLGTEPDKFKDFGVDYTPIPELLYERYEKQKVTVISTNLPDSKLAARYGKRIMDRFEEMCQKILFLAPSYREVPVEDHKD